MRATFFDECFSLSAQTANETLEDEGLFEEEEEDEAGALAT